jgi:hypothetical protein
MKNPLEKYSDNQLIAFILESYANMIQTGNIYIDKEDIINSQHNIKIKKLTSQQENMCDRLSDLKNCFVDE